MSKSVAGKSDGSKLIGTGEKGVDVVAISSALAGAWRHSQERRRAMELTATESARGDLPRIAVPAHEPLVDIRS